MFTLVGIHKVNVAGAFFFHDGVLSKGQSMLSDSEEEVGTQ